MTESTIMADPKRALQLVAVLSAPDRGRRVKIDKSFVMQMSLDDNSAIIVRSTIELGHSLGSPSRPQRARAGRGAPGARGVPQLRGLPHPRLAFLGDVFAIPAGFPLANVFSIGDVLIVLGVGWGAHRVCGSRRVPALRRDRAATSGPNLQPAGAGADILGTSG